MYVCLNKYTSIHTSLYTCGSVRMFCSFKIWGQKDKHILKFSINEFPSRIKSWFILLVAFWVATTGVGMLGGVKNEPKP